MPVDCHAGGRKRSPSTPTSGLWGASTLAKIATSVTVRRIAIGMTGSPCDRSVAKRQASVRTADVDRVLAVVAVEPFIGSSPREKR